MLGCYALIDNNKILFLLRERDNQPEFNGLFVATQPQYYDQLEQEIHNSTMEFNIDGLHHSYLFLSEDLDDFDEKIKKVCEMIKAGDVRIGKSNG